MPPAIEEEEELEYASSSEHTASPHQLAGDDAVLINTFDKYEQPSRQPDREESPVPVVSDIPLVVSDIPQVVAGISNGVAAPPPQPQHNPQPSAVIEKGTRKSRKRKASPKLPMAKRRRGQKRDFPCTYCVRRMANDPSWACHEAAANQFGEPVYTGSRCSECVGAHVSCLSVPPHGMEPVTNLMKAAQELVRSENDDGTQNIALLAVYEAAIGPALRAIAGVTLPPSEKGKRGPKKTKTGKKPSQDAAGHKPRPLSLSSKNPKETPPNGPRSRHGKEQQHSTTQHRGAHHHHQQLQQQQPAGPDPDPDPNPASFYSPPQPPPAEDPGTFEKMERQALRRRKVEALESLAHTAALFLAEFMDFKKTSSSTANGTGGGGAYAAAAAGIAANLFQPPTGEEGDAWVGHQHDGAGEERSGRLSDSENSANGSDDDDDQDIPARFPQGEADGEEYDSEETPSEALEDFNMGPGAGQEEPDVKVEDD